MTNDTQINSTTFHWLRLLLALTFFALALLCRYRAAPVLNGIPANFSTEYRFSFNSESRDSPNSLWRSTVTEMERADQVLVATGNVRLIQGDLHVYLNTGKVLFEQTGLYGVDITTMQNQAGFGNTSRHGYYYFPPDTQKQTYVLWDINFGGPRTAEFSREERLGAARVYVFTFSGNGMDETEGYRSLPGVPDLFHAHTDTTGTISVDPVSGVMLDYQENGTSYFVDVVTRDRVADFHIWHTSFTPATRGTQASIARIRRQRIYTTRIIVPAALSILAIALLITSFHKKSELYEIDAPLEGAV